MGFDDVGAALGARDPRTLGPWRVLRRLGQGGMGSVYLCVDEEQRLAAVKTINGWLADTPDFLSRFRREAAISAKVSGPQVAEVLGFDLTVAPSWLALRYVPGPTLAEVVDRHGPLRDSELRSLALGLLRGLLLVHAVGITHRDLKPSNIIWNDANPVIIDFGISRAVGGTAITNTAQAIGTAGWMSPEQILGHPPAPSSDLFAWAAVVAFAATGRPPFGAGSVESLTYRVMHTEPDLRGVPAALGAVLTAALRKDARSRPSATTILSVLAGDQRVSLDPPTLPASPPTAPTAPAPVVGPPARRRRGGAAITVGIVAAGLVLGIAGAGLMITLGRDDPADPPSSANRSPDRTAAGTSDGLSASPASPSLAPGGALPIDYSDGSLWELGCRVAGRSVIVRGEVSLDADADGVEDRIVIASCYSAVHDPTDEVRFFDGATGDSTLIQASDPVVLDVDLDGMPGPDRAEDSVTAIDVADGVLVAVGRRSRGIDAHCCPSQRFRYEYAFDGERWSRTEEVTWWLDDQDPVGYEDVMLGMSGSAVRKLDGVARANAEGDCIFYSLPDGGRAAVTGMIRGVSSGTVSAIDFQGAMAAASGVRVGSTLDEVQAAYHDLRRDHQDVWITPVGDGAHYSVMFDSAGEASSLVLADFEDPCLGAFTQIDR